PEEHSEPVRKGALHGDRRAERGDRREGTRLDSAPGVRRRRRGGSDGWLDGLARGAPQREQQQAEGGQVTAGHCRARGADGEEGSTSRTSIRSIGRSVRAASWTWAAVTSRYRLTSFGR